MDVLGLGGDVRADVADDDGAMERRDDDGDAGTGDALERPHAQLRRGDTCAGVAGGDDDVGLAPGDHLAHHRDRAVRLGADRLDGRVIHLDDLRRRHDVVEPLVLKRQFAVRESVADNFFIPHEVNGVALFQQGRGVPAPLEDGGRRTIAAHHVHRSAHE